MKKMSPPVAVRSSAEMGHLLQRLRKQQGMTQADLGDQAVLKQKNISTLESGAPGVRLSTLFRVLTAMNLEIVIRCRSQKKWTPEDSF